MRSMTDEGAVHQTPHLTASFKHTPHPPTLARLRRKRPSLNGHLLPQGEKGKAEGIGEGMRPKRKLNQARELRKTSPPAEAKLWEQLRNRQLEGYKFTRQATIGPYIVDFLCREKKLAIELDGWTHSTPEEMRHDQRRTEFLNVEGYRVVRYYNSESLEGMDELVTLILEEVRK